MRCCPVRPAPLEYPYLAHETEHLCDTNTSQCSTPGPASTGEGCSPRLYGLRPTCSLDRAESAPHVPGHHLA